MVSSAAYKHQPFYVTSFSFMALFVLTEEFGTFGFYVEALDSEGRLTRGICGLRNVVLLCEVLQSIAFIAAVAELQFSDSVVELERIHHLFFAAIRYKLCYFFIFAFCHYCRFALHLLFDRFA